MLVVLDVNLTYCTSLDFLCVSTFSLAFRSDPAIILQTPWSANAITDISFDRSNYFYDYGMYYPKFTILALYFELFPNTMPKLRMSLYIATAFTVMCSFTTLGLVTFYCKNVSDNWSLEPGKCSSFNSLLVLQIDWAMNFSSDVASKSLVVSRLTSSQLNMRSLRPPIPSTPSAATPTKTKIRPPPHIHTRPRHDSGQPRPVHHSPDRKRLEQSIRLVDGRDERRHHRCIHAGVEVPPHLLEKTRGLRDRVEQLLQQQRL